MSEIKQIVETIRVEILDNGIYCSLDPHLNRLVKSIDYLNFKSAPEQEELKLHILEEFYEDYGKKEVLDSNIEFLENSQIYKLRLIYSSDGSYSIEKELLEKGEISKNLKFKIMDKKDFFVNSNDSKHSIKYLPRMSFDDSDLRSGLIDELVWLNERMEICEGSKTNIFWVDSSGQWYTPALACGILAGTMRAKLIKKLNAQEVFCKLKEFIEINPSEIILCNAIIGARNAELINAKI